MTNDDKKFLEFIHANPNALPMDMLGFLWKHYFYECLPNDYAKKTNHLKTLLGHLLARYEDLIQQLNQNDNSSMLESAVLEKQFCIEMFRISPCSLLCRNKPWPKASSGDSDDDD